MKTITLLQQKHNLVDFEGFCFAKNKAFFQKIDNLLDDTHWIRVVSIEGTKSLKKVSDPVVYNDYENKNLCKSLGVLVSCWGESHLVKGCVINWFHRKYITCVWENGYGGLSFCCKERANKHPNYTLFVADDKINLRQYFNMSSECDYIL